MTKKPAASSQADKLAKMMGRAQSVDRPSNVEVLEREDVVTSNRLNVQTAESRPKREPGKRASGHVQLGALIPENTRDKVRVALVFDKRDLSDLLTDLLNDWLDAQPEHVQKAIEASQSDL